VYLFKYSSADLKSLVVRPAAAIKIFNRARNEVSLSIIATLVSVIGHGLSPTILLESQGGPRRPALSGHLRDYRAYRHGASCTRTVLLVQRDNSSEFRTLRCSLPSRSLSSFHFAKY